MCRVAAISGALHILQSTVAWLVSDREKHCRVVTFVVRDGKVAKITFVPSGELSGPPGFYTLIGGIIF
jgi:hypothetical protein